MIPKVIHYCWFGRNDLPPLATKCIASWKKYFPDYEIKEWNEDNFDVNQISYTKEAYGAKKYAFVSDYARFWILYNYGGIYFDTDVEVIKSMSDIVDKGAFMGCEGEVKTITCRTNIIQGLNLNLGVNPGLGLGATAGHSLYKEILDMYMTLHFVRSDGTFNQKTVVSYVTEILSKHGLKDLKEVQECDGIWIYPVEYFCPISIKDGKLRITNNTRSIHHFAQSWQSPFRKYGRKFLLFIGGSQLKNACKKILKLK